MDELAAARARTQKIAERTKASRKALTTPAVGDAARNADEAMGELPDKEDLSLLSAKVVVAVAINLLQPGVIDKLSVPQRLNAAKVFHGIHRLEEGEPTSISGDSSTRAEREAIIAELAERVNSRAAGE